MKLLLALVVLGLAGSPALARDFNREILDALVSMPEGGGYSVSSAAGEALRSAVTFDGTDLEVDAHRATPSYCSGATYLLLLEVLDRLHERGQIQMSAETIALLAAMRQPDGHGVWGRWNANGPGAAGLFHEVGIGTNFTDDSKAKPGDFMKIFWTEEVGKRERGHLVVYLGRTEVDGEEHVRFWSSNQPNGYGAKSVPASTIAQAIYSRLESPQNINRVGSLPRENAYLASLLSTVSSFDEAKRKVGAR